MKCDIKIDPKNHDCFLAFELENLQSDSDLRTAIAILTMVAGDYSLDPEVTPRELGELVKNSDQEKFSSLVFIINEDEIEAEYL